MTKEQKNFLDDLVSLFEKHNIFHFHPTYLFPDSRSSGIQVRKSLGEGETQHSADTVFFPHFEYLNRELFLKLEGEMYAVGEVEVIDQCN